MVTGAYMYVIHLTHKVCSKPLLPVQSSGASGQETKINEEADKDTLKYRLLVVMLEL